MSYDARKDPQPFRGVAINPGTGPVEGTTPENALANMIVLVGDAGVEDAVISRDEKRDKGDGRYGFLVRKGEQGVEVDMPGLPLDEVRYLDIPGQSIWDFPRLYVGGSSWVWCYAVDILADHLSSEHPTK